MSKHDSVAKLARDVLELRRRREEHLPSELFGEHAWGILLVLFIADADGERLTATQASARAGTTERVGARWLTALKALNLVACPNQCDDGHMVVLTPQGVHAVEACMFDAVPMMVGSLGKPSVV